MQRSRRTVLALTALVAAATQGVLTGPAARQAAKAASTGASIATGTGSRIAGDFNGDGYIDLAIGSGGVGGPVDIYYGSAAGLSSSPAQTFTATSPGMPPQASASSPDGFGFAVVGVDINQNGFSDLVIGIADLGYPDYATQDGGAVVLYGTPQGLSTQNAQFIANPPQVEAVAGSGWSWSLAAGDFNKDGYPDVVFAAPFDGEAARRAGSITVMYGSATGLTAGQIVITENSPGMPGPPGAYDDGFSWTLSAGDFNKDGVADLAIGDPGKSATIVLYGSTSGLTTVGSQFLQGIGPYASYTIATGDFNGDGYADLAVGEPCANQNVSHGIVEVHYGGSPGLGSVPYKTAKEFWPTKAGMPAAPGKANYFGYTLTAGRFHGGSRDDLAVGTAGIGSTGGFYVLRGAATGLVTKGAALILDGSHQQSFGAADFNGDGYAELLAGEPSGAPLGDSSAQDTDLRAGSSTGLVPAVSLTLGGMGVGFSVPGQTRDNQLCGGP